MKNLRNAGLTLRKSLIMAAAVAVFGISSSAVGANLPGKGHVIKPIGIPLDAELFQYQIVKIGLEKLGYKVDPLRQVQTPIAYLSIANGDADYNVDGWFPQHSVFYDKVGGNEKMVKLGPFSKDALQGYLIDKKTAEKYNIKDIGQLKDPKIARLFDTNGDGKADLTGCEPGWSCQKVMEGQLDAYGLRNTVHENQGSYFALMANTIARYKEGKPTLYYTWTPLWVSDVLIPGKDVEWLTVPFTVLPKSLKGISTELPDGSNLGFPVNDQYIVANKNFIKKNPAAKAFFQLVKIPVADINAQNLKMRNGEKTKADVRAQAAEWVKNHQKEFDHWISEAASAAK